VSVRFVAIHCWDRLVRVDELEFPELLETTERLIRLSNDSGDTFSRTWHSLTGRQQFLVVRGLAETVAHLRAERDTQGYSYGPPD
jgi:hypothetical protein